MAIQQFDLDYQGSYVAPSRLRAALKLVPGISTENPSAVDNRTFIGIIASIFVAGLLALLTINTSLTSGAFTAENLKLQLASMNDQRDAALNQIATFASPDRLAASATKLGMVANPTNSFLTLNNSASVVAKP